MKLKIEERQCENPEYCYGVFFFSGLEIGRAWKKRDGWMIFGRRKVLTADEAALAMAKANLKDARRRKLQATADEVGARMILLAMRKTPNAVVSGAPADTKE